jgi:hypothetical protein
MIRGRYLISMPQVLGNGVPRSWESERRTAKRWHLFAETCRSLHRDGLPYTVDFNLTAANPHILIIAEGTAKPRRLSVTRRLVLHPPIPVQRCHEHVLEVEWFLPENRERRNAHTTHWRARRGRYAELDAMAEEELRADLEFWRELESLSNQREHFKPGRTDDMAHLDDEVLAA